MPPMIVDQRSDGMNSRSTQQITRVSESVAVPVMVTSIGSTQKVERRKKRQSVCFFDTFVTEAETKQTVIPPSQHDLE